MDDLPKYKSPRKIFVHYTWAAYLVFSGGGKVDKGANLTRGYVS
jgi:hypothetical protein